jgi:hypothetical protein
MYELIGLTPAGMDSVMKMVLIYLLAGSAYFLTSHFCFSAVRTESEPASPLHEASAPVAET